MAMWPHADAQIHAHFTPLQSARNRYKQENLVPSLCFRKNKYDRRCCAWTKLSQLADNMEVVDVK